MPRQQWEKIGELICKSCNVLVDVTEQKNRVAYAHCLRCGVRVTGSTTSPEPLCGLEHHGAAFCDILRYTNTRKQKLDKSKGSMKCGVVVAVGTAIAIKTVMRN